MLKRTDILPILAACAAFAFAPTAVGAQAGAAPIFPGPNGAPHYLLGVSAYGKAEDQERLASAAAANGWPTARDLDASGRTSLVIAFPGANAAQVDAFLKRAAAGEFGAFTFESTMAPVAGPKP